MLRDKVFFVGLLSVLALLVSCKTQEEISYLQNLQTGLPYHIPSPVDFRMRSGDRFQVQIENINRNVGERLSVDGVVSDASEWIPEVRNSFYTVDSRGMVCLPVIGDLKVEGMSRDELVEAIRRGLVEKDSSLDVAVSVDFLNLSISVLGEVGEPGRYQINRDCLTLLEALSMAGDLTIYGRRDNVSVLRIDNDTQQVFRVDLRNAESLYSSPVFYLQQNDVVYVEPNKVRARQSTVNGNSFRSVPFWLSLASLVTTITLFFVH